MEQGADTALVHMEAGWLTVLVATEAALAMADTVLGLWVAMAREPTPMAQWAMADTVAQGVTGLATAQAVAMVEAMAAVVVTLAAAAAAAGTILMEEARMIHEDQ